MPLAHPQYPIATPSGEAPTTCVCLDGDNLRVGLTRVTAPDGSAHVVACVPGMLEPPEGYYNVSLPDGFTLTLPLDGEGP